jgi:hypothetical protein
VRADAVKAREAVMTGVYNYFAIPAVRQGMCDTALAVANGYLLEKPEGIVPYAISNLARFESEYQRFFNEYDQYVADSTAWDLRYGDRYGPSQPGYVAVHGVGGNTIGASLAGQGDVVTLQGEVVDPETGARIPILTLPETETSMPVVQPVPQGEE